MPDPGPLKRTLYPPSHSKPQAKPGSDVEAVKRAISRAGFWKWQEFSDDFTNGFAHGDDANGPGVAGYQRSVGLDGTGTYGKNTHEKLRKAKVPKGATHAGEDVFDARAVELYAGYAPPDEKTPVERVRAAIVEFAERAIGEGWTYSQNRAVDVSVNPDDDSNRSDCSGTVIQAFHFAKRETGLDVPDPAKQGWSGYGNTSYYECEHPKVTSGSYLVGDLAHYDGHVTVCYRAGDAGSSRWLSFGSEPPSSRELHYRSDFWKVVRPPLVKS